MQPAPPRTLTSLERVVRVRRAGGAFVCLDIPGEGMTPHDFRAVLLIPTRAGGYERRKIDSAAGFGPRPPDGRRMPGPDALFERIAELLSVLPGVATVTWGPAPRTREFENRFADRLARPQGAAYMTELLEAIGRRGGSRLAAEAAAPGALVERRFLAERSERGAEATALADLLEAILPTLEPLVGAIEPDAPREERRREPGARRAGARGTWTPGGLVIAGPANLAAWREALAFERSGPYSGLICATPIETGGVGLDGVEEALGALRPYGLSQDDEAFYRDFYARSSQPRCWLPAGHPGRCSARAEGFFEQRFKNKLNDAITAPGQDYVVFKNRAARFFPVQITSEAERELRRVHNLTDEGRRLKAAVPTEQGATAYLAATAQLDMAALILLQKDLPAPTRLPTPVIAALRAHAARLVAHHRSAGITIVDETGHLCDPWTLEPLELAYWGGGANSRAPHQIQFGHVSPVRADTYMTRGMNILPMTRTTNLMQGDRPFTGFVRQAVATAARHRVAMICPHCGGAFED